MVDVAARIGGKGASLWAMTTQLGLPVPPGFTIGTEHAVTGVTDALFNEIVAGIDRIGHEVGKRFGDSANPLLVSVRSGAAVSMPGMMDTILNVGVTAAVIHKQDDPDFARATHDAFINQFVKAVPAFDHSLRDDPYAVLRASIDAVFASWNSPRAQAYRAREQLPDATGTAVTIQAMVFGNRDARSGTGVIFSRDPSTGAPGMTGDWLAQAQGEAIVAGTHRTLPIETLATHDPPAFDELVAAVNTLETFYRDMVDVEFTIESGRLWILQARVGKRAAAAAARIAHDLVEEGRLSHKEAIAMVPASLFDGAMLVTRRDGEHVAAAHGLGVSPGLVSGRAAFDCDAAIDMADAGDPVILVRRETSPDDVHGMGVSVGILTATGGAMSHAALVAREWGIAAVCGADIDIVDGAFVAGARRIVAGDMISIDGATGEVFVGRVSGTSVPDTFVDTIRTWALSMGQQEEHRAET